MIDEKINQKYLEKIKLFQKYNKHYYDLNNPLVDDNEFDKLKFDIIKLEKDYNFLNHKNDTDIITFDYSEGKTIIAEVFISTVMMIDNAQKYMQSVENECIRLISHGLFHCLGYKDKSSKEKEIMRKKEEEFIFAVSRETNQDV